MKAGHLAQETLFSIALQNVNEWRPFVIKKKMLLCLSLLVVLFECKPPDVNILAYNNVSLER